MTPIPADKRRPGPLQSALIRVNLRNLWLELPTWLVTFAPKSVDGTLKALREHQPAIIARAVEGKVAIDVRTLGEEEGDHMALSIRH